MQAIQHTINAAQAESVTELEAELAEAHAALARLEEAKLDEFAAEVERKQERFRRGAASPNVAYEIPREKRPIRDNPQA